MFNTLFGEGQYALKMLFAFIVVFGLLALALWLVRRFSGERLSNAGSRGRQPRLAVIDAAQVDSRRRLVLVRRDNVEHLLMIGGPSDLVVEPNIVRAGTPARERHRRVRCRRARPCRGRSRRAKKICGHCNPSRCRGPSPANRSRRRDRSHGCSAQRL